jgi:hypothetical protein
VSASVSLLVIILVRCHTSSTSTCHSSSNISFCSLHGVRKVDVSLTPAHNISACRACLYPTPNPQPSTPHPSCRVKGTPAATPATVGRQPAFTPGSTGPRPAAASIAVAERAGVQPIAALNPYQKNVSCGRAQHATTQPEPLVAL